LTWSNIDVVTFEGGVTLQLPLNLILDSNFVYGTIVSGNNQDSDYSGNNRTQEFSRSNNNSIDGHVLDFSISGGYQLDLWKNSHGKPWVSFIPKAGYSYSSQNFRITNGVQTLSKTNPFFTGKVPLGSFSGLHSTYDTKWYGPWTGIDTIINLGSRFALTGSFEYHYAYYEATANWNLRTGFAHPKSFVHKARGTGINASIGSLVNFNNALSLRLSVNYKRWKANRKGFDTTFLANGNTLETGLNAVNWKSVGANIGLQYRF